VASAPVVQPVKAEELDTHTEASEGAVDEGAVDEAVVDEAVVDEAVEEAAAKDGYACCGVY